MNTLQTKHTCIAARDNLFIVTRGDEYICGFFRARNGDIHASWLDDSVRVNSWGSIKLAPARGTKRVRRTRKAQ